MKLTFLGSGSAFTTDNYQSNMLLEFNGKRMLFDCGGDIRWALKEKGLHLLDIDCVYISHLHADHTGGLEGLAFMNKFIKKRKIPLYINEQLIPELWDSTLKGGLESIQMVDAVLDTYFSVKLIKNNEAVEFDDILFKPVQTIHVVSDTTFKKSFGLFITSDKKYKKVFITSDTQFAPAQLKDFIKASDLTFHDCETVAYENATGVHAHYKELKGLPVEIKSKMWLYHWNGSYEKLPDAKADGFLGFVQKGQEFEF